MSAATTLASTEASNLAPMPLPPKDPAKVAAGQKGGQTRAANAAAKHTPKQPEAATLPVQAPKPPGAVGELEEGLPRRREDRRRSRVEIERNAAMPEIARGLRLLFADHWIDALDHVALRTYLALLVLADEYGRVYEDAELIVSRLWSDPPRDHYGERELPKVVWDEVSRYLARLGLIEFGEDRIFVYVTGLAPEASP